MPEGNSAIADPQATTGQPNLSTASASPAEGQVEGVQNGEPIELSLEQWRAKAELNDERYKNSSREAHRLVEEKKSLESKLDKLAEQQNQRSLTTAQTQEQQFPDEETYVKHWVAKDKSDIEAREEYKRDRFFFDRLRFLETHVAAQANMMRFEADQRDRVAALDPQLARDATEAFKDIPELAALPIAERVERFQSVKSRFLPQTSGRDTSALKAAAGGTIGNGGGKSAAGADANMDQMAKEKGFPSFKAMEEMNKCTTASQYAEIQKKYKIQPLNKR